MRRRKITEVFKLVNEQYKYASYTTLQQYHIIDSTMINQCITLFIYSIPKNMNNET